MSVNARPSGPTRCHSTNLNGPVPTRPMPALSSAEVLPSAAPPWTRAPPPPPPTTGHLVGRLRLSETDAVVAGVRERVLVTAAAVSEELGFLGEPHADATAALH